MKIFTRFLTFTTMLLVSGVSFAQLDLAVTDIYVSSSPNNTVPTNFQSSIYFTVENTGDEITPQDSIVAGIQINANEIHGPVTLGYNANFPNGATSNYPFAYGNIVYYTFDGLLPSYEVCAYAFIAAGENDSSNNIACQTITVNPSVNNDWSADEVIIHEPADLDGFDLDNNQFTPPALDSLTATFTNRGVMTYVAGTRVIYSLVQGEDTNGVVGTLQNDLAPGENTTRIINNATVLPDTPQDSGTYEVCAVVQNPGDEVDSNDVTCDPFTIIDSYDPFVPGNWPSGRDEVTNSLMNIVPKVDQILIEGVNNPTEVTVTDAQGRMVQSRQINNDATLQMTKESAGVYIIQAQDSKTGAVERKKVSIQ